jgi:hypothetical protein
MNGPSAGAGSGGEGPLVYQAWKGNNVSPPPALSSTPPSMFLSPILLGARADLCVLEVVARLAYGNAC